MSYVTNQKLVLGKVIEDADRPLTAHEICEEAQKELPTLGIATVYRAIKQFRKEGLVRAVELPGATPRYEHSSKTHHHFFFCNQCKKVFNLIGCLSGIESLAPKNFRVRQHEIVLYGDCQECAVAG